ncbi:hypothetical protein PIROE2DRAFT_6782 [Piromyces sp. E2]|nr:hypothetical protein PIROE2DRAFT_6782 [Piromyces sp. E2]|eukprot:OUM66072.1 hypothetical protein PIROE2DRAFT_6782 [Piromyces sp. E2]
MKYFTKIVLLVAAIAELNVMAQGPTTQCLNAFTNFHNSNEGKVFNKCVFNNTKNVCGMKECSNLTFPKNVENNCKSQVEKLMIKSIKDAFSKYNKHYKNVCNNKTNATKKPVPGKKPEAPKKPETKKTEPAKKPTQQNSAPVNKQATTTAAPNVSTPSSVPSRSPVGSNGSTSGTVPSYGTGAPAGSGAPVNTYPNTAPVNNNGVSTGYNTAPVGNNNYQTGSTSGLSSIVQGNNTSRFNNGNAVVNPLNSAGNKLSFSLVTVFVLAALNLLL